MECFLSDTWSLISVFKYSSICYIKEIFKSASIYRTVVEKCQGTCLSLNRSKWQKFVYSHINIAVHAFFYSDMLSFILTSYCCFQYASIKAEWRTSVNLDCQYYSFVGEEENGVSMKRFYKCPYFLKLAIIFTFIGLCYLSFKIF